MSGTPYWIDKAIGKSIFINDQKTILRGAHCVSCRVGYPNSDELVFETDLGNFNTSDTGVSWRLPDNSFGKQEYPKSGSKRKS